MVLFIMLSSHCWLRPGETLKMLWDDFSSMQSGVTHGIVRIGNPKIRKPAVQHVLVEASFVSNIVILIKAHLKGSGAMFPWSPTLLTKKWNWLLEELGVEKGLRLAGTQLSKSVSAIRMTPGGLRAGAATADYIATQNHSRTLWRGRWANAVTLRHYLQFGAYYLTALTFDEDTKERIVKHRIAWHAFVQACGD